MDHCVVIMKALTIVWVRYTNNLHYCPSMPTNMTMVPGADAKDEFYQNVNATMGLKLTEFLLGYRFSSSNVCKFALYILYTTPTF